MARKKRIDWALMQRMVNNTIDELVDNKPIVAYRILQRLKEVIEAASGDGGR